MKRLQQGEPGYEIDIIENNKENILPLREGRKVSHLSSLYSKSAEEREAELKEARGSFELRLSQTHGKEAFDIFCDYINWTHTNYPEGNSMQSKLFELIERTCFGFCKEQILKEDQQYFNFWAKYIKLTDKPVEVFTLLDADKIGVNLSARYEEEANYYEKQKKIHLALEAYKKGLEYDTLPPGALERSYQNFRTRIAGYEKPTFNPSGLEALHLANNSRGAIPLDSTAKQPKSRGMEILRDPEGTAALEGLADNTCISNYGPKSVRTQENIITQTSWGALKIPQVTAAKPCRSKIKVMRDEPGPAHLNFKDIPASSIPHLASSKASSDTYFVERGSAPPAVKFNIVAAKGPSSLRALNNMSFEEQRYASIKAEENFKQPESNKPLPNSKSAKESLSRSAHDKKKSYTACPPAANPRPSLPFSGSVKVEKKRSFGLPRCSSVHTLNFKNLSKLSSYIDDGIDETFLSMETSRDASIAHSSFGTPFDPNSLDLDVTMPQTNVDGSLELTRTPSMKVLLSHPTINTARAMEDADNLYNQSFGSDPDDFFTNGFAFSDEDL